MTLKNALDKYRGIGPGFHFMRHLLSVLIILFHCRECVYWNNVAKGTAAPVMIGTGLAQPSHFNFEDIIRPGVHALVGTFFALSGFLIAGSALRTRETKRFVLNRVLRIFPALGVETLISAFILGPLVTVLPLSSYFTDRDFFHYFGNMIGHIHFTLPGVFNQLPLPRVVNGQLWTLPAEFYCYIITAAIMITGIIYKRSWVLAATFSVLVFMTIACLLDPVSYDVQGAVFFKTPFIVLLFWIGAVFFMFADYIRLHWTIFIGSAVLYWLVMFYDFATPVCGLFLVYCMAFVGFTRFQWWDKLVKSDFSYGMFLYHFPLIQTLLLVLLPYIHGWAKSNQLMLIFPITVIASVAVAALSWHLVEKPALSLRKVFARTKAVADQA